MADDPFTDQAAGYTRDTGRWWPLDTVPEIAQATGMIAAQLGCPASDAVTALHAHATAHDLEPTDITVDVVIHSLPFSL